MANNIVQLWLAQSLIKPNSEWVNKKHLTTYTVVNVGRDSEPNELGKLEVKVCYVNEKGDMWFRPWQLFLEKFNQSNGGE